MNHQKDLLSQEVKVHYEDRNGWVRIFTDPEFFSYPQLPVCLSGTLTHWFKERPQFHLRCLLPICRGGDTVELHAWYDLHVFPSPGQVQSDNRPKQDR
jgi:hypothetical protein